MGTTREALEAALAAEPENVALHSAYADLLIEEGDPRGEYIRLELALEDEWLTDEDRIRLRNRTTALFELHEKEWLGPLYAFVQPLEYRDIISTMPNNFTAVDWRRGWIDCVDICSRHQETANAINKSLYARMIRKCHLFHNVYVPEITSFYALFEILKEASIKELALIGFWDFGDEIIDAYLSCSLCEQIRNLTFSSCGITDTGALTLAASANIRRLTFLSLDNNYLSPIGVAALAEVGFEVGPQLDNPAWDGRANAD